jgi:hypothetical protein
MKVYTPGSVYFIQSAKQYLHRNGRGNMAEIALFVYRLLLGGVVECEPSTGRRHAARGPMEE